jgi:hypothetical protein
MLNEQNKTGLYTKGESAYWSSRSLSLFCNPVGTERLVQFTLENSWIQLQHV